MTAGAVGRASELTGADRPSAPLIAADRLSKRFGAIEALRGVSLDVRAGEVVALVGENGAGKSTLIKILAGVLAADGGELRVDGGTVVLESPADATRRGIAVLHQELQLCDNLSVAANVCLGREPLRWPAVGWIDRERVDGVARRALRRVGLEVPPRRPLRHLSHADRQRVEIARAIATDARLVVLDEPTSSLGAGESERLLELIAELRRGGAGVLYVSHRLAEVVAIADRAVVLRDGRVVARLPREQVTEAALVHAMTEAGAEADGMQPAVHGESRRRPAPPAEAGGRLDPPDPIDRSAGASVGAEAGASSPAIPTRTRAPDADLAPVLALRGLRLSPAGPELSFELYAGEILGLFGVVGAGRSELLETLFGLRRAASGTVEIAGDRHELGSGAGGWWSVARAMAAGIALVPEDRKSQGLVSEMTVAENLALARMARWPLLALRRRREERRRALAACRMLDVRPPLPEVPAGRLSGGNQQKVVLGKGLELAPRILLLDEPTRGVDVAARAEIHRHLRALAGGGVAILLSSADSEEVLALAGRVLVLARGAIAGAVSGAALDEASLLALATGSTTGARPRSAAPRDGPAGTSSMQRSAPGGSRPGDA